MMMISRLLMSLLTGTTAHAAIIKPLDEMKVLEIPISQDGLTRIKIYDDRILHVFGNAGEYVLETDENQGQVFIRPTSSLEGTSSKPISLTLTTEAGHTQDLRLLPKHQGPEAIVLKLNTDIAEEIAKEKRASAPLFREEVEELIHACREGRTPLGYKEIPLNLTTLQGPHLLVREIRSQKLRGLTYRVQNKTSKHLALSKSELAKGLPNLIALLIPKKILNPREGTDFYVVARAN